MADEEKGDELARTQATLMNTQILFAISQKALRRAISLVDRLINEYVMLEGPDDRDLRFMFEAATVCGWPICYFCGMQYRESDGVSMLVPTPESLAGKKPGNMLRFVCCVCVTTNDGSCSREKQDDQADKDDQA